MDARCDTEESAVAPTSVLRDSATIALLMEISSPSLSYRKVTWYGSTHSDWLADTGHFDEQTLSDIRWESQMPPKGVKRN